MVSEVYVVTGVSRGIGLEWLKQLLASDDKAVVIGVARNITAPGLATLGTEPRLHLVQGDLADTESINKAAKEIAHVSGGKVDVLINNAAINFNPGRPIEQCVDDFEPIFQINVFGTVRFTLALLPLLRTSTSPLRKIVNTTSFLGSHAFVFSQPDVQHTPYSCAKAAINMFGTKLSKELGDGFVVISMNPGWVDTEMSENQGFINTEQSVNGMKVVIGALKQEETGKFFNYDGTLSEF